MNACSIFKYAMPVWLLGILYSMNIFPNNTALGSILAIIWISIPLLLTSSGRFLVNNALLNDKQLLPLFIIFFVAAIISGVLSNSYMESFSYTAATMMTVLICGELWPQVRNNMENALIFYSVLGVFSVLFIALSVGASFGERLTIIRNPNSLSLIMLGIMTAALLIKNILTRSLIVGICFIVVLWTGSRSGLFSALIALSVFASFSWRALSNSYKTIFLYGFSILVFLFFVVSHESIILYIRELLHIDDQYRGLHSGFTGRYYGWVHAIEVWLKNVYFGIGYRLDWLYFSDLYGDTNYYSYRITSAHNGYLTLLMEVGIVGFVPAIMILIISFRRLYRMARHGCRLAESGCSLIAGYLFVMIFERYFFNIGNPTSILVLIYLLIPVEYYSMRKSKG